MASPPISVVLRMADYEVCDMGMEPICGRYSSESLRALTFFFFFLPCIWLWRGEKFGPAVLFIACCLICSWAFEALRCSSLTASCVSTSLLS